MGGLSSALLKVLCDILDLTTSVSFLVAHTQFFAQKAAPKIVTLCGSQRIGSFNKAVHDYAVTSLTKNGAEVTRVDLGALKLPLYDPNSEEESFPENAKALKTALQESGESLSSNFILQSIDFKLLHFESSH